MSKIFENKSLLIHIIGEIVVVIGITFYFSQKNKKLMGHINDLIQRIEEQEDIIQKHEQLIKNLTNVVADIGNRLNKNNNLPIKKNKNISVIQPQPPVILKEKHVEPDLQFRVIQSSFPIQNKKIVPQVEEIIDEVEEEDELKKEEDIDDVEEDEDEE